MAVELNAELGILLLFFPVVIFPELGIYIIAKAMKNARFSMPIEKALREELFENCTFQTLSKEGGDVLISIIVKK